MRKLLIITYYWPPGSGAGVQRWLKFSKYLPQYGWEPYIVTVDPEYAAYPVVDNTLSAEVSDGLKVFRTKATDWFRIYSKDKSRIPSAGFAANDSKSPASKLVRFVRGNFFIPDPRKGWNRYALDEASRLIEDEGIEHVITTSPPHSTQLIGLKLQKKYPGITWVADLRDPWTDIYYYDSFYHTPVAKRMDAAMEKNVLKSADRIITVGWSLRESFCRKVQGIESKTFIIPNGYDHADFEGIERNDPDVFTISYIGTLSDSYPVSGFAAAAGSLARSGFRLRLRFTGAVSPASREILESAAGSADLQFSPHVSHQEAVRLMVQSSALLLVIPDHHSNRSILTGKLFEYLASGRPVICLGPPDGDAAEILRKTSHGSCAGYSDTEGIAGIIREIRESTSGRVLEAPAEFSRTELTGKLASLLG